MLESLYQRVVTWMDGVAARYDVHPLVFLILTVVCAPFFYFSIYKLVRALARRDRDRAQVATWSTVFLIATALPYLYVLVLGRNLPWWIYGVLVLLLAQGIYSLIRKFRPRKPAEKPPTPPAETPTSPPPESEDDRRATGDGKSSGTEAPPDTGKHSPDSQRG